MRREEKTADQLQQLIQERMDELDSVRDAGLVIAPRVVGSPPDKSGCNWNIDEYSGPPRYASVVRIIVDALRKRFTLSDSAGADRSSAGR